MNLIAPVCLAVLISGADGTANLQFAHQSARSIPIVARGDVVVVGGSLGAVSAAVEASEAGASVTLVAPRTFVGDDLCSTLRLWLEEDEEPEGAITRELFSTGRTTTPLRVKRTLEARLLEADVHFLLASLPTDVLRNTANGKLAGVVIANRGGRQAIVAKVIIDATESAVLARLAGVPFMRVSDAPRLCRRVVLGGRSTSQLEAARRIPSGIQLAGESVDYFLYERQLHVGEGTFAELAEAEQRMRDETYRAGQLRASERIEVLPLMTIRSRARASRSSVPVPPMLDQARPRGTDRLFVLGASADVLRSTAARLGHPDVQERWGRSVGAAAAAQAAPLEFPEKVAVAVTPGTAQTGAGDVGERLTGLRPTDTRHPTADSPPAAIPVWADVDVLVVGGGTSGACAAIGAARRGARVLVVEFQEGLGGVGTIGLIGRPYHGLNRGFTAEVPFPNKTQNTEDKMEWFRRQIRDAGGQIWFGVIGCGAYVEQGRVHGAAIATPMGRCVVRAQVVIDATGNADIAVAAGADSMYGGDSTGIALQGTGLPRRPLSNSYVNTDYLLVDESDMVDTWRAFVGMRLAGESEDYDVSPFIQTRERRRVVGDHVMSYLDQIAGRTYCDSIVLSGSDYDSHGYPSEPYFALIPHTEKTLKANHPAPGGACFTPYRCLLPRGIQGMLVTGLGISMLRDASAMVRMQKDMHNQGYAAGVAAAMAAEQGVSPREIDVRLLQRHLVDIGNLPQSVLSDTDSFPLPAKRVAAAVGQYTASDQPREARCRALAILLTHTDVALPLLRHAYADSPAGDRKLAYARLLGFLGQRDGVPELLAALEQAEGWDAKIFQGNMAEYAHLPTKVDSLILALGYSQDPRALQAILPWLEKLDSQVTLSHHRAVALALERLADPAAAEPLARLLAQPGMSGHAMTQLEPLYDRDRERRRRTGPLREIVLARALLHCGDHEGLGKRILQQYQSDVRGLFARHATAVLE